MKAQERQQLLLTLAERFTNNMQRHKGIAWSDVQSKFVANPDVLTILLEMESTGGEPDVIGFDKKSNQFLVRV